MVTNEQRVQRCTAWLDLLLKAPGQASRRSAAVIITGMDHMDHMDHMDCVVNIIAAAAT